MTIITTKVEEEESLHTGVGAGWLGLFEHKKFEKGVFMVVEVPAVAYAEYRCPSQVRKSSVEEKG